MHHPTDRITHSTTYVTPVVEHWLEREIKENRTNAYNILKNINLKLIISKIKAVNVHDLEYLIDRRFKRLLNP